MNAIARGQIADDVVWWPLHDVGQAGGLCSFLVADPCREHRDGDLVLAVGGLHEVGADQSPQSLVGAIHGTGLCCQDAQPCAPAVVLLAPEFVEETGLAEGSVDGGLDVGGFGPKAALIVEAPAKLVSPTRSMASPASRWSSRRI